MTVRPSSLTRLRTLALALLVAGPLALLSAACGGEAAAPADAADASDTGLPDAEPLPDFSVGISASKLSGNAPLTVDFSVAVAGEVDAEALIYSWTVDGTPAGEGPTFSSPFYRSGSFTVALRAEYIGAGGSAVAEDSVVIRVQGCADLTFDRLSLEPPVEVAPGDVITLRAAELFNDGDTIEGSFDVLVALSVNETFEPDQDLVIDRWAIPGMASGLFTDVSIDYAGREIALADDAPEGFYYVFIVADPDNVVNECQETNNLERSTNNLTIDPAAGLKPDVTLTEVSLPAGLVVRQGQNINYSFTIANLGLGDSTQFRIGFWLSTDPVLSPETDRVVASPDDDNSKINNIGPGVTLPQFFKSYHIPEDLPDGQYWLIGQVDARDEITESDETNNVRVSATPLVMQYEEPTCFDLAATSLVVEPLSTYWNGSVLVSITVANPGTVATPDGWLARVFLSQQQSLNPATAQQVGAFTLPLVPPGETRTFDRVIPISDELPILPHYVGVILDPDNALSECVESNNAVQFGTPITINPVASVDLDVGTIVYHPSTVTAGEIVKLEYAVSNHGTSGATAFTLGFVLSADSTITRATIKNGTDILIGTAIVSSVPANGTVSRVDDVVIPIALDHTVDSYYLGVVADVSDPVSIGQDTNAGNNIEVAAQLLTVVGAQGGCYEDGFEDNDSLGAAARLEPGLTSDLGACGDVDWFVVDVPASSSLLVDLTATPILSLRPVASELVLELRDPAGQLVATSDTGSGFERLRRYAVTTGGDWALTVRGRSASVRAAYDLDVRVVAPPAGADLVASAVDTSPDSLYPGGLMNVGWVETNTGLSTAGPHQVRVWASLDRTLDLAVDVPVAQLAVDALAPLATRAGSVDFVVPSALPGGTWYMLVEVDADDDVVEADESNNVEWGASVLLDAAKVCDDDGLEPNDELRIATPVTLTNGAASLAGSVVCPGLPDWYAVEVSAGQVLSATAAYTYTSSKGLLQIELWDPSGEAQIVTAATSNNPTVTVPWVWLPGTWYVGVSNKAQGSNIAPYTYTLNVTAGPGEPAKMCIADSYEDNNAFSRAKPAGCGVLSATLCNADRDVYVIEADEGVEVRLTMAHPKSEARTRLYTDPGATAVKTRTGNGLLTYTPLQDGLLYIEVDPKSGPLSMTEFGYDLTIEGIAGIDLSVEGVGTGAPVVLQGEDVLVDFRVVNGCTEDAAPFVATVWLSQDPFLDDNDVDVALVDVAGGVAAGDEVAVTKKVTVPLSTLPGDYFVLVEADSSRVVPESNEQNNVSAAPITVDRLCLPDAYEPNDYIASPSDAPLLTPPGADMLEICPGDQDWFAVAAPAGSTLTVSALFSQAEGDLDLRLYDPTYSITVPVASSTSDDDDETIVYPVPLATTFLVRVVGFQGASAAYELVVVIE
ncbi:MAG: hypothetical protein CVU56_29395 [Deltaproteobacteria bacterium HGW-Deltaproteobacteria-14]|jgi:hypothetical protein|nr:MAG: hypothetical protein CVU56_29395 [Deltaproteobacteria bacterium HGW-Deltaproteobacteria-14]